MLFTSLLLPSNVIFSFIWLFSVSLSIETQTGMFMMSMLWMIPSWNVSSYMTTHHWLVYSHTNWCVSWSIFQPKYEWANVNEWYYLEFNESTRKRKKRKETWLLRHFKLLFYTMGIICSIQLNVDQMNIIHFSLNSFVTLQLKIILHLMPKNLHAINWVSMRDGKLTVSSLCVNSLGFVKMRNHQN